MKKIAKSWLVSRLGSQVLRLREKNKFIVIAVAGSIGKTSTKLAIAQTLSAKFKVQWQDGNYNDIVTVPLIFFGAPQPSLFNVAAWLKVLANNEKQLKKPYPYDIVVIELGTDGPGQIKKFSKYIKADIGVLTAISPEHMEFFKNLDAVAEEELTIAELSDELFVNKDLCPSEYLEKLDKLFTSYGVSEETPENQAYSIAAAMAVAKKLGMTDAEIKQGIQNIKPVSGRMQQLKGINNSTILDDTYNASPQATKAALNSLYKLSAPQKIAILGNMNELGSHSEAAHTEIGELCDPKQLDLVVTIGPDANKYLAKAAKNKGCEVKEFSSPYEAGAYLKSAIKDGAAILAKGSQNGVFAEEAVKSILADPADSTKLVRQSKHWLKIKAKQFGKPNLHDAKLE